MRKQTYDLIVSLGGNCAVANQLLFRDMRPFSLPLDYVFMVDYAPIKYLQEAFKNRFEKFCLKENLVELVGEERADDRSGNIQYKDTYSGFRFIHHFPKPIEQGGVFDATKETLNRRIERLFAKIDKRKKILFVLNTNFAFDVQLAIELKNVIAGKWKNKKITFLVIQFGAEEDKTLNIKKFGTLVLHKRKMHEKDFFRNQLPEWQIFNYIKLNQFDNIFDKYKFKIWSHLGKELKRKSYIK